MPRLSSAEADIGEVRLLADKRLASPAQSTGYACSEAHVSMVTFEGFVESTSLVGDQLQMRLMVGGFDPSPTEPPVLKVTVEGLDTAQATYDELQRVLDVDDGVYLVAPAKFRLRRWLQARRNLNFAGATTYR